MYKAHINGDRVQSCKEHSIAAAELAKRCAETVGLANTAYLCGLLHDVGKCTNEFNEYIEAAAKGESVVKGSVIHTFAGFQMILKRYHSNYNTRYSTCDENEKLGNLTAELIAIAIGSHHGQFDIYGPRQESGFAHRFENQPEYDKRAAENFEQECASAEEIDELFEKSSAEVKKLYCEICKQLIKSIAPENQGEEMLFYLSMLERFLLSALIEGDRRDTSEFMQDTAIQSGGRPNIDTEKIWSKCIKNLQRKLDTFSTQTPLQCARRELSEYCEKFADNSCGIYRLNLPTGAGKTLSGMRYALKHAKKYGKKRIIFVIPLLSILEQNASVIRETVDDDSLILEHHSNVVVDAMSAEECERQEFLTDTWEAPMIITTLVQLLNTMFDGKPSSIRRFHSLADSVIVIDEVQTVPTKMLSLFNLTLNFLSKICNTTFLLCSATQPRFELNSHKLNVDERDVVPPDVTAKYHDIFKRTQVQYMGELGPEKIMKKAEEHYKKYHSVLIICNTKKEACELFNKARYITKNCIHLSTAMCMAHRKAVISTMIRKLENKEPLICVSTQLIEAGVDVSFGAVIRLAAGIDSVAQAAGRANRNGEFGEPSPVGVAYLKGEDLSHLKEIKLSQDITGELIAEYKKNPRYFNNDLISDSSVSYYYNAMFRKINAVANYTDYCAGDGNLMDFLSLNSKYVSENTGKIIMRQAFKTAGERFKVFDNRQSAVIVPYGDGMEVINNILSDRFSSDIIWSKKVLKEAKEYIVELFDYQLKKLAESGAVYADKNKTVRILNPDYYDSFLGVITQKGDESEWNTLIL